MENEVAESIPEEPLDLKSIECKRKLLFDASIMGDIDTVEILLAQGVDPNYLDQTEGVTPLIGAIKNNQYQLMEVLMLNPRTNLDAYDVKGYTGLLHLVTRCPDEELEKKLNLVNIRFILEVGANVNLVSKEGSTPLFYACLFGLNDVVSLLLARGALPNIVNAKGLTPLHNAAAANNLPLVVMLIRHGADVNMRDYDEGLRPLDLARNHDIIPILNGFHTSISHPIVVDFIDLDVCPILKSSRIGMSMCPGRHKGVWKRNLSTDLDYFVSQGANAVVTLVTKTEMHDMGIPNLVTEIEKRGMMSIQYSIQNKWIPNNSDTFAQVVHQVSALIREGKTIIVHCNGGKGRTGLIITACLVLLGLGQDEAINAIRSRRPGMLYNPAQQIYLLSVTSKILTLNQVSDANESDTISQNRVICFEDSPVEPSDTQNSLVPTESTAVLLDEVNASANQNAFDPNLILQNTLELGTKSFHSFKDQFNTFISTTPLFNYTGVEENPTTTSSTTTTTTTTSTTSTTSSPSFFDSLMNPTATTSTTTTTSTTSNPSFLNSLMNPSNSNLNIEIGDDDEDDYADLSTIGENIKKSGDHV
jgi:protein-tyrosine phosphatase